MNVRRTRKFVLSMILVVALVFQMTPMIAMAHSHFFVDGFCTHSGESHYEPATKNGDGAYVIDNAGKLFWFAALVNEGHEEVPQDTSADAVMTDSITMPDGYAWTPIGVDGYSGTFNGGKNDIYNLVCSDDYDYAGLFGKLEGATVQNIYLYESSFVTTNATNGYAGAIAGL